MTIACWSHSSRSSFMYIMVIGYDTVQVCLRQLRLISIKIHNIDCEFYGLIYFTFIIMYDYEATYFLYCRWSFSCWDLHWVFRLKSYNLQCLAIVSLLHVIFVMACGAATISALLLRKTASTVCWLRLKLHWFDLLWSLSCNELGLLLWAQSSFISHYSMFLPSQQFQKTLYCYLLLAHRSLSRALMLPKCHQSHLSVRTRVLWQNGWLDPDTVWGGEWSRARYGCIRFWCWSSKGKGQFGGLICSVPL